MQHIVGYYRVTSVNAENPTLSHTGDIFLVASFVAFLFLIFRIIAASSNTSESFSTAEAPSVRYNMPELFVAGQLGGNYGLRRSEALGLKWDAIDFQNNTITIRHTVTSCNLDGKHIQIAQDTTKTKSSMRTLPLVPAFKEKLLKLKEQQEEYKRVCGRCYNKKYLEYICVDEMGTLISPHYLTSSFPKLLEKNNLRHIRFHDLRHSCASLLLANGVPMKQIQEWLGHSDFSTTANVYAHLDYNSKLSSADAMVNGLSGALEVIS